MKEYKCFTETERQELKAEGYNHVAVRGVQMVTGAVWGLQTALVIMPLQAVDLAEFRSKWTEDLDSDEVLQMTRPDNSLAVVVCRSCGRG